VNDYHTVVKIHWLKIGLKRSQLGCGHFRQNREGVQFLHIAFRPHLSAVRFIFFLEQDNGIPGAVKSKCK
jgi:hypothetical protein